MLRATGNVKVTEHNEGNAGEKEVDVGWGPQPRDVAEDTWVQISEGREVAWKGIRRWKALEYCRLLGQCFEPQFPHIQDRNNNTDFTELRNETRAPLKKHLHRSWHIVGAQQSFEKKNRKKILGQKVRK